MTLWLLAVYLILLSDRATVFSDRWNVQYSTQWLKLIDNRLEDHSLQILSFKCRFIPCFFLCIDFPGFSDSFNDVMECSWWNLWVRYFRTSHLRLSLTEPLMITSLIVSHDYITFIAPPQPSLRLHCNFTMEVKKKKTKALQSWSICTFHIFHLSWIEFQFHF